MAILRINKTQDYTVMSNYHFREKKMSLKAKGLLSLMLSLPDNWDYSINGLVAICKENETSIKTTLNELKEYGYLNILKVRNDKGQYEYVYDIFEIPHSDNPDIKKPEVDNPGVDNPGVENIPLNKELNNKLLNNKELNNIYNNIKEKENIIKEKENPIFEQKEVKFEIVEKEEPITITDEEQIFNHWNSKEIVKHRELTKPLKDEIKKKIKELGFDNIILGIDHYAEILQDKKYFFNYAWSLIDFLKRKNGITNFLDEGSQWQSYVKQSSKYKNKREEEALENWAKKDYQGTTLF